MTCDICGSDNKEGRKFCKECGNPLAVACLSCGSANEPDDKFCGNCGAALGDAPAPAAAVTSEAPATAPATAEQRFVSVLFADIVGYTTLSEGRDSEDIRDMLTVYFERAREIIERFGGVVDKFIGDAVMGIWGATTTKEDDAQRAVRAALELVDTVAAMGEELNMPELVLRAGVNSGRTSVSPGGNEKGLVVGDLVNVASRLQSIAEPGMVFVGPATYEVSNQAIDYEDMGEQTVKGKTEAVHAYKALRVASMIGGRAEDDIRQPPFVGREREMRLLKDGLAAVEAENRARLISLVGEGGIGKTRLAEEFKNHIDGYTETIYWHWGRSPSYGDGVTFWALGEIVRRRAGIIEGEEATSSRTRLRTMLTEFVPDADDRDWIEPRLAGLLGLAEMPSDSRSELFAALRSFFQNVAATGPTVIVFEDLHWADEGLLDFITELVERSTKSPMLVVTLARPDLLDRRVEWGSQHRSSMGVRLAPLPEDDMRRLVSEYIPGVDQEVVEQIVAKVSGFPLYAVEIVRMLLAAGELASDGDRFQFVGDPSAMALPETLQTVIGARLDRLDPDQRSTLQDGSVLGLTFTLEAIATLRDEAQASVEKTLSTLVNLELLDLEDDPRSPERGQYGFVQGLIREVAYQRLNRDDRRAKHLAVAEFFESADDPELAGIIASHYMGAYEATPPGEERQRLVESALASLTDAAARAAELHSHVQAMSLLDEAIEIAEDGSRKAELRIQAAWSADRQPEVDRGLAYLDAARDYYTEADDMEGLRRTATAKSKLLNSHYRSVEALETIVPVYEAIESFEDPITIAVADEAGRSFALTMNIPEALEASDRVLAAAQEFEMIDTQLETLINKGTALAFAGRRVEALTLLRGTAIEAENRGLLRVAGRALNNLIWILASRNPQEGLRAGERLRSLVRRMGEFGWLVRNTNDLSFFYADRGMYEKVEDLLQEDDEEFVAEPETKARDIVRATIELRRNPTREALASALGHLDFFAEDKDPQISTWYWYWRGWLLADLGEWEQAFDSAFSSDPSVDWHGLWLAANAAAWLQDAARARQVQDTITASSLPHLLEYVEAIALGLEGDREGAARLFADVLETWSPRLLELELAAAKAVFARVVGLEQPEAAQAAQEAYDWCVATGTNSSLQAWAPVLPAEAAAAG